MKATRTRSRTLAWVMLIGASAVLLVSVAELVEPRPGGSIAGLTPRPSMPGVVSMPTSGSRAVATRVVIASLGIDLPVISGDTRVPEQGPDGYPPCDVALYLTSFRQPGQRGTTYLYAHARPGMFLPLLEASEQDAGKSLSGVLVDVYTSDDVRHTYAIKRVKRHALDLALAQDIPRGSRRLVLQTSEGPRGTVPKLQVLAVPRSTSSASPEEARPVAVPRGCHGD